MRLVQFLQVVVLLGLAAYVVLTQLENPTPVRLPLPGGLDPEVPLGLALGGALIVGGLYASLLYVPRLLAAALRRRQEVRAHRELEHQLSATLHAKLAGTEPGAEPQDAGARAMAGSAP